MRPQRLDLRTEYRRLVRWVTDAYSHDAASMGVPVDDWLQEVMLRLHRCQSRPSAYDPSKGSLYGYVLLVARSVLLNMATSKQRRHRRCRVGMVVDGEEVDPSTIAVSPTHYNASMDDAVVAICDKARVRGREREVLTLLLEGHTQREVAAIVGGDTHRTVRVRRTARRARG